MEKLTHVHPIVPVILFVPVILYFLFINTGQVSTLTTVGLFSMGVLLWTLSEYLIHRWVFHYEPKSDIGQKIHFLAHGVHHDYPRDPMRLVLPPSLSIPLAFLFYGIFSAILGPNYTPGFFAGYVFGYLCYDMIHYGTHHFSMKSTKAALWLKHYHSLHHYEDDEYTFGVSSPLWDYVFRTTPGKSPRAVKRAKNEPVRVAEEV
jgi:sterol desaturase/sphingolipid hydroxylase (fatty acid hydroxylase superfamily)